MTKFRAIERAKVRAANDLRSYHVVKVRGGSDYDYSTISQKNFCNYAESYDIIGLMLPNGVYLEKQSL